MSQFRATGYSGQSTSARFAKYAGEQFENPTDIILQKLEAHGCQPRPSGKFWMAFCPVHADPGINKRPNLQIGVGDDGDCVVDCFAHACSWKAIMEALGLQEFHLFRPRWEHVKGHPNGQANGHVNGRANGKPKKEKERTYQTSMDVLRMLRKKYDCDEEKNYRYSEDYIVSRFVLPDGKLMMPISRGSNGFWGNCGPEGVLPLFNLEAIQRLPSGSTVWVVEGEKCVQILGGLGIPAVTSAQGNSSAHKSDWSPLMGYKIVLNPDNDSAGEIYTKAVADLLWALQEPPEIKIIRFNGLPDGGDIEQHLELCRVSFDDFAIKEDLDRMVSEAPLETPPVKPETSSKEALEDLGIFDMDEDEIENVDWIEEDVIGTGGITIIAGEGGLGKSQIAMSFAAVISNGGRFPCSDHDTDRGYVLVMSSEDKKKSVIIPRLKAAGADLSMVKEYKCYEKVTDEKGQKTLVHRSLQDYQWFDRVLAERPETRLVVMDSIKSFLGPGVNENSELDVRRVLEPIGKILEERNVALLGISHTNKGGNDTSANNLLSGTQAFRNIVRCLFYTFMDNEEEGRLFLAANKNNEGALHRTFVYRITPMTVRKKDSELVIKTSRIDWEDELSDLTCDDCLAKHRDKARGVKRRQREQAGDHRLPPADRQRWTDPHQGSR